MQELWAFNEDTLKISSQKGYTYMNTLQSIEDLINHINSATFLLVAVTLMIHISVSTIIERWLSGISEPKTRVSKFLKTISKVISILLGFIISLAFFGIAISMMRTSILILNF